MPQKFLECHMCGAVLAPEDLFCGECGEPLPGAAETIPPEVETTPAPAEPEITPAPAEPETTPAPAEPETAPTPLEPSPAVPVPPSAVETLPAPDEVPAAAAVRPAGRKGWVIGASVAGIAGSLMCLVGAVLWAYLAFTPPPEGMTEAENVTLSTLCCGLPLVGPAVVLVAIAAVIWYVRLRNGR
jgi:hypothetical protein